MLTSVLYRAIEALAGMLDGLLAFYFWMVLISALLSWVNPDPRNPIVRFLYSVTEPVLYWMRRRMPFLIIGNVDLSPLVLLLAIQFIGRGFVVGTLRDLARRVAMAALAPLHVG